jgi:hypothetical protein
MEIELQARVPYYVWAVRFYAFHIIYMIKIINKLEKCRAFAKAAVSHQRLTLYDPTLGYFHYGSSSRLTWPLP